MIDTYINEFIEYLIIDKKYSENTVKSYHNDLKKFDNYINKQINNINDNDIKSYIKYLNKENNDAKTISHNISTLRSFYKFLLIEKKVNKNPMEYIELPKTKKSLPKIKEIIKEAKLDITKEQIDKILFCIEHHEDYNWNGSNVKDINTLILQDADNLDAIGAIGIGRSFGYAAINNQLFSHLFLDILI